MGQEYFHLEKSGKHSVTTTKDGEFHSQDFISAQEYVGVEKTFLNDLISKRYAAYSNRLLLALIIPACVLLLLISYLYFHNTNWNKEVSDYRTLTYTDVTNATVQIPTTAILTESTKVQTMLMPPPTTQPPLTDPLELVILLDRSSQIVLREMPRLVTLLDTLSKDHNQAKYGLALYSDFQCTDWSIASSCSKGQAGHNDPDGCYTFTSRLTCDIDQIKSKVQLGAIKHLPSGYYESGIAALMMTAADKRMGWTDSKKKVILVITDDATHHWSKYNGIKNTPKGDGSDRCATMDNPTIEFTATVLKREGISLFLLLSNGGSHVDAFKSWEETATKMKIDYSIVNMMESVESIGKKFEIFLTGEEFLSDYDWYW